ncbi:MAG: hypothetical protein WKH64_01925 [Chloroflexia bacterium]
MRRYLQSSVVLVLAFIMALASIAPVGAQDGEASETTFELTLYGDVPEGDRFTLDVSNVPGGGSGRQPTTFCGDDDTGACQGRRTSLSADLEL